MTGFLLFLLAVAVAMLVGQKRRCWRLERKWDADGKKEYGYLCALKRKYVRDVLKLEDDLIALKKQHRSIEALRREAQESF